MCVVAFMNHLFSLVSGVADPSCVLFSWETQLSSGGGTGLDTCPRKQTGFSEEVEVTEGGECDSCLCRSTGGV